MVPYKPVKDIPLFLHVEDHEERLKFMLQALAKKGITDAQKMLDAYFKSKIDHCTLPDVLTRMGRVAVLYTRNATEEKQITAAIAKLENESWLCFLDYELALSNGTIFYAKTLMPLLANGPRRLCMFVSSQLPAHLHEANRVIMTCEKAGWLHPANHAASSPAAAIYALNEGLAFWEKKNGVIFGDASVDSIIRLFINGKSEGWDRNRPCVGGSAAVRCSKIRTCVKPVNGAFCHDTLECEHTVTRKRLAGNAVVQPKPEPANDYLKSLYQCESGMLRGMGLKPISRTDLGLALCAFELEADLSALPDESSSRIWYPPYLPGILFLCQLKLMMNAFSTQKRGENRLKPTLRIRRDCVVFDFGNFNISEEKNIKNGAWKKGSGNSAKLMQAIIRGHVGETEHVCISSTSAQIIAELLQPAQNTLPPMTIELKGCEIHIGHENWND